MKKSEVKVGGHYTAKISGKLTTVRVDAVRSSKHGNIIDRWDVTNLTTGRKTTFRTAGRFRNEVKPVGQRCEELLDAGPIGKLRGLDGGEAIRRAQQADEEAAGVERELASEAEELAHPEATADRLLQEEREGEQSADPTARSAAANGPARRGAQKTERPDPMPAPSAERTAGTGVTAPQSSSATGIPASPATTESKPASVAVPPALLASIDAVLCEQPGRNGQSQASHLIVEARAGTGKTTTLICALQVLRGLEPTDAKGRVITPSPQQKAVWDAVCEGPEPSSVCFVAFNKSIATELQARVPQGCAAMTMHSMGFKAVTKALGRQEPNSFVVQDIIGELLGQDARDLRRTKPIVLKATEELVSLCKMNLTDLGYPGTISESRGIQALSQLASHYDVDLNGQSREVFELVPRVLERCKTPKGKITFDDMIWLPVVLNLPVFRYDLLLVDECLPGWTPVMMADGRSATIKEIVESDEEFRVRAYDTKTGTGRNCRVVGKQRILNQKPLVKVKVKHLHRTGTNRKCNLVVCTTDHKVWTVNRGWVEAGELLVGDCAIVETAAATTQKGKITTAGRDKLATLQKGNERGLGNTSGTREGFLRIRGGNGRGPTFAEQTLMDALGFGWEPCIVKTGDAPQYGRGDKPSHYKIDIANRPLKIAIEVDGNSHRGREEQDAKKQEFLEGRGWVVVRVPNRDAVQRTSSVVAQLVALAEQIGVKNCPRPARIMSVTPVNIPDNFVYDITVEDCHNFYANGILVHNCQDLNRCQQALAKKAGKRLVLCGDPKQAIYGFAGADAESMPRMIHELGDCQDNPARTTEERVKVLPLTVTRRCGKAIVAEANKIVPDFSAHESNPEGKISQAQYPTKSKSAGGGERPWETTYMAQATAGDMVLCRVNAPLVGNCFRFLKHGIKATIQGRDVGAGLASTVKKLCAETDSTVRMVERLDDWLHKEQAKENAKRNPSEVKLISLRDRVDCLYAFAEGATTVKEVLVKIASVFTDDKNTPGIKLSSIHKSKGLEARRVFLLQPEGATCPHPMAKSAWQRDSEQNLLYVAVTRAIEELTFVS